MSERGVSLERAHSRRIPEPSRRSELPMEESVIEDFTDEADLMSDLDQALEAAGYPLNAGMRAMLQETRDHRFIPETYANNRKGSGFSQFGWMMSEVVNKRPSPKQERVLRWLFSDALDEKQQSLVEERLRMTERDIEGEEEIRIEEACRREVYAEAKEVIGKTLSRIDAPGERLYARMMLDALGIPSEEVNPFIPKLALAEGEMHIGSCTTAELYFLEYGYGLVGENRREAREIVDRSLIEFKAFNYILDDEGKPLMIEKVGLGNSHSCLTLREVELNGVHIPAGSLMGVRYDPVARHQGRPRDEGVISAKECQFQFLRLSTLAVEPEHRAGTFGMHLRFQESNRMPHAADGRLEDFQRGVDRRLLSLRLHEKFVQMTPEEVNRLRTLHLKKYGELQTDEEHRRWEIELDEMGLFL